MTRALVRARKLKPLRRCIATQWEAEVSITRDDDERLVVLDVIRGLGRARLTPMQARELAVALNEAARLAELGIRSSSRMWNGSASARTVGGYMTQESRGGGFKPKRNL